MTNLWYAVAAGLVLALYFVYVSLVKKKNNLKEAKIIIPSCCRN